MKSIEKEIVDIILFSLITGLVTVFCAICLMESHDGDFNWYCVLGKAIVNGKPNFHGVDAYSWIAQERGGSEIQHSWLGTVIAYGFSVLFQPIMNAVIAFVFATSTICALVFRFTFLKNWNGNAFSKLLAHCVVIWTAAIWQEQELLTVCFLHWHITACNRISHQRKRFLYWESYHCYGQICMVQVCFFTLQF